MFYFLTYSLGAFENNGEEEKEYLLFLIHRSKNSDFGRARGSTSLALSLPLPLGRTRGLTPLDLPCPFPSEMTTELSLLALSLPFPTVEARGSSPLALSLVVLSGRAREFSPLVLPLPQLFYGAWNKKWQPFAPHQPPKHWKTFFNFFPLRIISC